MAKKLFSESLRSSKAKEAGFVTSCGQSLRSEKTVEKISYVPKALSLGDGSSSGIYFRLMGFSIQTKEAIKSWVQSVVLCI